MTTAHDVAAYILRKIGRTSAMKLQKLLYYCQAWCLVWDDRPLFAEPIEAWANGPVVPDIYKLHREQFDLTVWPIGNPDNLDKEARDTVNAVLKFYAKHNAQWLSDLTHTERPWREARAGLDRDARGNREITLASMAEYYSSLNADGKEAA